jgi:hypothetical protein
MGLIGLIGLIWDEGAFPGFDGKGDGTCINVRRVL